MRFSNVKVLEIACFPWDKLQRYFYWCSHFVKLLKKNVAEKYGISREVQDKFAVESHRKATKAQELGLFSEEIVPVKAKVKDAEGKVKEVLVTRDDGVRKDISIESLAKLKPAFKKGGTTTAGNASQVLRLYIPVF